MSITDIENGTALSVLKLAKIAMLNAEMAGQLIDNRTAEALAISAEIAAKREQNTVRWDDASNGRNREYHFTDTVDGSSVAQAVDTFSRWDRIDSAEDGSEPRPYKLVICSVGGSVVHGMKLYGTLKALAARRPLVTVASGMCASMATVIHQTGTTRLIEPGCSYLLHDVSGESSGSVGTMQDTMVWMEKLNHALHVALAEKSKLSVDEIAALGKRRDGWFMPEEVVEMGLADAIGFSLGSPVAQARVSNATRAPKKGRGLVEDIQVTPTSMRK